MGRAKQFSYDGREALYDYLWEVSEDTGQDVELDVIATCCEFVEYPTREEAKEQYGEEHFDDCFIVDLPSGGVILHNA